MGTAIQTTNPLAPPPPPAVEKKKPAYGGLRKAAILMIILGDEAAVEIYRNLRPEDIRKLTQEIAQVETISPAEAIQVLDEYRRLTLTQDFISQGGPDYANHLVLRAFGDQGAKGVLDQIGQGQRVDAPSMDSLQKADPQQLVKFVEGEHPQTIALILAHLGVKSASSVLLSLPEKVRADAVKRLAQMQEFSAEMVNRIALVLQKKLAGTKKEARRSQGGVPAAADMLKQLDAESSKLILEAIQLSDPDLAGAIREQMFTFDDLASIPTVSLREILAELDKKNLALALKGAREEMRNTFYKVMSSRAVEMLKEDIDALGSIRIAQVQQAQQEVVALARRLEVDGKISLKSSGDGGYVD